MSAGGHVDGRICRRLRDGLIEFCFPNFWDQSGPGAGLSGHLSLCVWIQQVRDRNILVGAAWGKSKKIRVINRGPFLLDSANYDKSKLHHQELARSRSTSREGPWVITVPYDEKSDGLGWT